MVIFRSCAWHSGGDAVYMCAAHLRVVDQELAAACVGQPENAIRLQVQARLLP